MKISSKRILTVLMFAWLIFPNNKLQAQNFPSCEECLNFNGTLWVFENKLTIEYRDSTSFIVSSGQFRTHPFEIFLNGVKVLAGGNETVSPVLEKTYQFTFDLAPYVGDSLEVKVREYKLVVTNGNQGGVKYETTRSIPLVPVFALDQLETHSIFFFDKPNSCGGGSERMTSFDGLPTDNQVKALTFDASKLFVYPKDGSLGKGFVFHFSFGQYDKVTVSTRGDGGNGREIELPIVDQPYFPRVGDVILPIYKSVEVNLDFNQLYRDPAYNHCVPVLMKLYRNNQLIRTTVIPLLVAGEETEVTKDSPTTLGAPIPQMIIHNPIGDGSTSYIQNSATTCSQIKTSLSSKSGQNGYLKLEVGVEGSAFGVPFKAGASTQASLKTEQSNSREVTQESCLTEVKGIEISNSEDGLPSSLGSEGDIFISVTTEYYYGPSFQIVHDGCEVKAQNGIGLAVKETRSTSNRQFQLRDSIKLYDERIKALSENPSTQAMKRNMENKKKAWEDMIQLNLDHIREANEVIGTYDVQEGLNQTYSQEVTRSKTFTMETKLFVESSLEGTVGAEVAGTGFEANKGISVSNDVGRGREDSENYSAINGYSLSENDEGDVVAIRVKADPYFGSYIFELIEDGSQTSCPYIGGKRRDVPALSIGEENSSHLSIEIPINEQKFVSLNVCNYSETNENRSYILEREDNENITIKTATGEGDSKTWPMSNLEPGECTDVEISIEKFNKEDLNNLIFEDVRLKLTDECGELLNENSEVTLDITFVEKTTSTSFIPPELRSARLLQNYPNAASTETTISYFIPDAAQTAELLITGIGGRVIQRHQIQGKGDGLLNINTKELSQGLWLYRLVLNGITIGTKKMVIIK